jgi:hypothetical protein
MDTRRHHAQVLTALLRNLTLWRFPPAGLRLDDHMGGAERRDRTSARVTVSRFPSCGYRVTYILIFSSLPYGSWDFLSLLWIFRHPAGLVVFCFALPVDRRYVACRAAWASI